MTSEYMHMIVNLLLVLALMFALVFLLKKFKLTKYSTNKHIKLINGISIGAKEKIILIEVFHKKFLIGATPHQVQTLHVFDQSETVVDLTEKESVSKSFSAHMKKLVQDRVNG